MRLRMLSAVFALLMFACPATAQQRPLLTEDPEPIGAGRILLEGGLDYSVDTQLPAQGLQGNLLRMPTLGVSVGISSIAEFQIDGGFYNRLKITKQTDAPLTHFLKIDG